MGKYLKKFDTHTEYETYIASEDAIKPNVSYCEDNNEVHYNPLPYQGFCKLTLNDGSTVELEGSGELTQAMVSDQYKDTLVSAEIGELCSSIGVGAFQNCSGLTSVTIPSGVTSISDGAFYYCTSLTSVTIPSGVTSIGGGAFNGCSGLTSVTIPSGVTSIGGSAFASCTAIRELFYNAQCEINTSFRGWGTALEKVVIGNSTPSIGNSAFASCSGLTSVTIGSSVASINNYAFQGCSALASVTIGNGVTSIGNGAFSGCRGLTSVTIGNGVTSIGDGAFSGCRGLTSVTIPNSVTSIGNGAFNSCSGLTSVTIGNGVTSIGGSAFDSCSSLTSVTIGNGVTSIGGSAFASCTSLTEVTIPSGVTSIGTHAFVNCSSLTSITSLAITAPTIEYTTFSQVKTNGTLTVPSESSGYDNWMRRENYYLGCYNWTKVEANLVVYYDIQDISAPTTIFTNYDNSVKSIDIDGKETISEFSQGNVTYQFDTVGEHVIKFAFNSPTIVGNNAPLLYNLTTVKRVVIPNTFTAIGSNAFNGCSGLTSITIGNSVTSIGQAAFQNCTGLTSITIKATIAPTIQNSTFIGVKTNGTLTVPSGSSGYDVWMQNANYYLGLYRWTKVEQ